MSQNEYFTDPEKSAEVTRLLVQESMLNTSMGGPLPERANDFSGIGNILDIGCGPAGWLMEIAAAHPTVSVTGIDISQLMIGYAQAQARVQGLNNASFQVMDATQPLAFADASFDLVNGRHMVSFLRGEQWPQLLHECWRITKPGGIIRIVGTELSGLTNSAAYHQLHNLFIKALQGAGRSLTSNSPTIGVMAQLTQLLLETSYQDIHIYPYLLDVSQGTDAYKGMYEDLQTGFKLVMPFLEKYTGTPLEDLERLYQTMLLGMSSPTFRGYVDIYAIVATKP